MYGFTPVPVPREVTDAFPQETFYSFPIEDIAGNATHVFFDFGKSLQGEFVRETPVLNSYEYGKAEHRWAQEPMSIFPNVAVGAAEKLLTLSHDGAWPTTSLDRAKAEQASRGFWKKWLARKMRRTKAYLTMLFLSTSGLGRQLPNAALDPNHLAKVVEFVQQNGEASRSRHWCNVSMLFGTHWSKSHPSQQTQRLAALRAIVFTWQKIQAFRSPPLGSLFRSDASW